MAVEHVDIIDSECHEPKGASSALAHQVMVSDGAGSGSYKYQTAVLNVRIDNISTVSSAYVVSPVAGEIETIYSVLDGVVTGTPVVLHATINNVYVQGSDIEIVNSSAGIMDSSTPTANKTVAVGDVIAIWSDGATTGNVSANITIVIRGNAA